MPKLRIRVFLLCGFLLLPVALFGNLFSSYDLSMSLNYPSSNLDTVLVKNDDNPLLRVIKEQQQSSSRSDSNPEEGHAIATEPLVFAVVASNQSGASWLLSHLQEQQDGAFCFPSVTDTLDPDLGRLQGTANYRKEYLSSICSYAFLRDSIEVLTRNTTMPRECRKPNASADLNDSPSIKKHLAVLCQWVDKLNGNYSSDSVLKLWIDSYSDNSDSSLLSTCLSQSCNRRQRYKGLKVGTEWLPRWPEAPWNPPDLNLNVTSLKGTKMINVNRPNMLARFHTRHVADHSLSKSFNYAVDTEDMLDAFTWMRKFDETGAAWVKDHASHVLTVDYETCSDNLPACLNSVKDFLDGTDKFANIGRKQQQLDHHTDSKGILNHITNAEEVKEALFANGYGNFVEKQKSGDDIPYEELWLLIYETDPNLVRTRVFPGIHSVQYMVDLTAAKHLQTKWKAVVSLLREMPPDRLVVLGDGDRDVSTNYLYKQLAGFKRAFQQLTASHNGAVVISASPYCCVRALTHVEKGGLFAPDVSTRTGRACNSNVPDNCPWNKNEETVRSWQAWMKDLMVKRVGATTDEPVFNYYLDAGLMVGTAANLLRILEMANIESEEDATAVLTDLMYRKPDLILLDYEHRMFGRYREVPDDIVHSNNDCVLADVALKTQSAPVLRTLILQNPQATSCNISEAITTKFPVWGKSGWIRLKPILEHIQRLKEKSERPTLTGVDLHFGPEVPYFVDYDGLWSLDQIRGKTSPGIIKWRLEPVEGTMKLGHLLMINDKSAPTRWPSLHRALELGGFPFFGWYGDFKKCNYHNFQDRESIPLLTNSGTVGCSHAFPTPSYQQVIDARTDRYRHLFKGYAEEYPFKNKIRQVVWRGTLSGNNPAKVYDHIRWRLCETVFQSHHDMFDVGLAKIPKHNKRANSNLTKVGGLASYISPMENFMKYLAILDMDGSSWSSRFGTLLCYNSVVIKIEPKYVDYFYYDLKPWTHYVPIRDDLSDLFKIVAFVMDPKNEEVIKDIIAAANQWCAARFHPTQLAHDMMNLFESYVRRLDQGNVNWPDEWNKTKSDLQSDTKLNAVQL